MTPSDVADLFYSHAPAAYRLTLNSGDVVDVLNPEKTQIEAGSGVLHVYHFDGPDPRLATRVRYVSINNIALIERIRPRPQPGRKRR